MRDPDLWSYAASAVFSTLLFFGIPAAVVLLTTPEARSRRRARRARARAARVSRETSPLGVRSIREGRWL